MVLKSVVVRSNALLTASECNGCPTMAPLMDRVFAQWTLTMSDFRTALSTVTYAPDLEEEFDEAVDRAFRLLLDHMTDWNFSRPVGALAPELLARCFSFLSFRDVISVSRVCRVWRDISLDIPSLWTDLELPLRYMSECRHADQLFLMALSRSGQLPLRLSVSLSVRPHTLVPLICDNMSRFRYIQWPHAYPPTFLRQPAPLLEELRCDALGPIPTDLCGGLAGSLRFLEVRGLSLPYSCPALSTVTHLKASLPAYCPAQAMSLLQLLNSFPALQSLDLSGLAVIFLSRVPLLPAQNTLARMRLSSVRGAICDPARYIRLWATASLMDVHVEMDLDACASADFAVFLEDATTITITESINGWGLHTHTTLGRDCVVILRLPSEPRSCSSEIAGTLLKHQDALDQLCSFEAPVCLCECFFGGSPYLPALRRLRVVIKTDMLSARGTSLALYDLPIFGALGEICFDCDQLAFLCTLARHRLSRIDVDVRRGVADVGLDDACRLTAALLDALPTSDNGQLSMEIVVHGVPEGFIGHCKALVPRPAAHKIAFCKACTSCCTLLRRDGEILPP